MYLYLYALILVFVHKMMYNRSRIRKGEEIKNNNKVTQEENYMKIRNLEKTVVEPLTAHIIREDI